MEEKPASCKKEIIKRIAITGPESTGKSVLAEQLALHFKTSWVPEFARNYIAELNRPYHEQDILHIAKTQLKQERIYSKKAGTFLFCDTELLVCKIWSENAFGHCDPWITKHIQKHHYDLYLLMDVDLPWQPDPLREHPNKRDYFFDLYLRELSSRKLPYSIISGIGEKRKVNAIKNIVNFFELKE